MILGKGHLENNVKEALFSPKVLKPLLSLLNVT